MVNKVQLLDCTLRDGGHINQGNFGREVIRNVIMKLVEANVDIIEVGFLWDKVYGEDTARYYSIEDVKRILPKEKKNSKFSLMADFIDLNHLEECDGTIEIIRLSFKRHRLEWGLETAKILIQKGYKVFINPVNCNVYTDEQYIDVLKKVNELKPYGFSIVDTFGVMRLRELSYRYGLVENNLDKDIIIGLHLHENLGLAYSLAQHYLHMVSPRRQIVIDASLLGMGRVPGNLCIEQIAEHLNYEYEDKYKIEPILDAIDDYISPIKKKTFWGYAIPYALSARYKLHRTYAEFLINKWKLRTSDIERILSMVDKDEAELFNQDYIESLYREYISVEIDDNNTIRELKEVMHDKNILLIAPGASINEANEKLLSYIQEHNSIVIAIHCIPENISIDFMFFTNIKRYDTFFENSRNMKKICTSNLLKYNNLDSNSIVLNYSSLAYHNEEFCDDSVIMLLNLMKKMGIYNVALAGFDGFDEKGSNFYISSLSRDIINKDFSSNIKKFLKENYQDMDIRFLTDSYYAEYCNEF